MTEEEKRQMMRDNYAAQMNMLGYSTDGNQRDMIEVIRCKYCKDYNQGGIDANGNPFKGFCKKLFHQSKGDDWYCPDGAHKDQFDKEVK